MLELPIEWIYDVFLPEPFFLSLISCSDRIKIRMNELNC